MDTNTRLSVLEAKNELIRSLVIHVIGWALVLTVAVVAAVLAVNSQFNTLEDKIVANSDEKIKALEENFDSKFNDLQHSIVELLNKNPRVQGPLIADQPVEQSKPTG